MLINIYLNILKFLLNKHSSTHKGVNGSFIFIPQAKIDLLLVQNLVFQLVKNFQGFPGGAVVENLSANAGDMGSSPGLGRSHMPRSNQAREPQLLSLRIWSPCSSTREAVTVRGTCTTMKSGPHLPQLEKALAQKRRPNTAKINKLIN